MRKQQQQQQQGNSWQSRYTFSVVAHENCVASKTEVQLQVLYGNGQSVLLREEVETKKMWTNLMWIVNLWKIDGSGKYGKYSSFLLIALLSGFAHTHRTVSASFGRNHTFPPSTAHTHNVFDSSYLLTLCGGRVVDAIVFGHISAIPLHWRSDFPFSRHLSPFTLRVRACVCNCMSGNHLRLCRTIRISFICLETRHEK